MEVAAATAGFISLSIQVTQTLLNFYSTYKSRQSDVNVTIKELEHLLHVLETLSSQFNRRQFDAGEQDLLESINNSIQGCEEFIKELQGEIRKIEDVSTATIPAIARTAAYRVTYPFRQSTLQKLGEEIAEIVSHLSLALQLLGLKDTAHVRDDLQEQNALLEAIRADQVSSTIREWLKAPDVTGDYNKACEKWHTGTGLWFVKGSSFSAWLTDRYSFLWLNGFAGCGKSVLFSTAVRYAYRHRRSNPRTGISFFFFAFNDESKQDTSAMLRALVLQLSSQFDDYHEHLSHLYRSYRDAMPPHQALFECLHQLVRAFDDVYILLDALDESPRDVHRDGVLQTLTDLRAWREPGLHLLVTSREETDIRQGLNPSQHETISLETDSVGRDIAAYVSKHLRENRSLRKWEEHYELIETALTERAKGVFRWVECQFIALQSCPRSKRRLERLLDSLPRSLAETYERMLLNIDEESIDDARRILKLLCCAKRPLTVPELIEGIAVELGDNPRLNPDGRLPDEDEIRRVCPGLIKVDIHPNCNHGTVRIVHFSVQEYLESNRLQDRVAAFGVKRPEAHAEIASLCLTYLLEPGLSMTEDSKKYPLASYAAKNWHKHYFDGDKNMYQVESQALQLFQPTGGALETWARISKVDDYPHHQFKQVLSPVYYTSLLGLESILSKVLQGNPSCSTSWEPNLVEISPNVNVQGGYYGNPLQAAASCGHEAIVQLLLEKGADVNAEDKEGRNALDAAASKGHEAIVRVLLEKGPDVQVQNGAYALHSAASMGHEAIVRLLLENSVDVNAQVGNLETPLTTAAKTGHAAVVRLLLENGADINAQGGRDYNILPIVAYRGCEEVVRVLLEKGADINAQHKTLGTALQVAAFDGHEAVVRLLIQNGANLNAHAGNLDTPLQVAASHGYRAIVQHLLENGANVNAQSKYYYGNALGRATALRHEAIVRLLLEWGAEEPGPQRLGQDT